MVAISFFEHQFKSLFIESFFYVIAHFLQVIQSEVILVLAVVFLKNGSDKLFVLVTIRLSVHRFHKLGKTDSACLLYIELGYNLINSLFVGIQSVLA